MNTLEIKDDKDKATIVAILAMNGYTVRVVTVKENERSKAKKVVQYEKNGGKTE